MQSRRQANLGSNLGYKLGHQYRTICFLAVDNDKLIVLAGKHLHSFEKYDVFTMVEKGAIFWCLPCTRVDVSQLFGPLGRCKEYRVVGQGSCFALQSSSHQ